MVLDRCQNDHKYFEIGTPDVSRIVFNIWSNGKDILDLTIHGNPLANIRLVALLKTSTIAETPPSLDPVVKSIPSPSSPP